MAFPSTILSLAHAAATNFLSAWFGGVTAHSTGDNMIIDDLAAAETKLGLGASVPTNVGDVLTVTSANNTGYSPRARVRLAETVLGAPASSVVLPASGSIPSTYRNLEVRWHARDTSAGTSVAVLQLQINADSGANYDTDVIVGNNATVQTSETYAATSMRAGTVTNGGCGAGLCGAGTFKINNYTGTAFHKNIVAESIARVSAAAGGFFNERDAGDWRSTAAITSLTLSLAGGLSFAAGSTFTLYGDPT